MKELSNKLSEAILQALEDLELCKNDPKYIIDFGEWHSKVSKNLGGQFEKNEVRVCSVCFAGSVMAQRLGADSEKNYSPSSFGEYSDMLQALDETRQGNITLALECIGIEHELLYFDVNQEDYEIFVQQMKDISGMLSELGY